MSTNSFTTRKNLSLGVRQHLVPTGGLIPFAGATATEGYLLCDGSSYDITKYADLYKVIGFTYGGSVATFNVPDLRGRMPMGAGTGYQLNTLNGSAAITGGTPMTPRSVGAWGGEETHLLTGAESGTSAHPHTASSPPHSHSPNGQADFLTWDGGTLGVASGGGLAQATGSPGTTGLTTATVTVADSTAANASSRHAVVPPFVVLNYLIKY